MAITLNEMIKSRRKYLNMTQADLAARIGVTQPLVNRWETGKNLPSFWEIPALCSNLGITAEQLFEAIGMPEKVEVCDLWNLDTDTHSGIVGRKNARQWVIDHKEKYVITVLYGYNIKFRIPQKGEKPRVEIP